MAELVGATRLPDLTPLAAGGQGGEGDPRPFYTLAYEAGPVFGLLSTYTPSDGGVPRLVVKLDEESTSSLQVWDTGTGAFLRAFEGVEPDEDSKILVTYHRPSDGRPRIAAGMKDGHLCVWDGDDFTALQTVQTNTEGLCVNRLAVYEEPRGGRTRLVTG
jgi:WD40 repeat protein